MLGQAIDRAQDTAGQVTDQQTVTKIWDTNQHEKLIERPQLMESKWRYRP